LLAADMLTGLTDRLRAFAHRKLEGGGGKNMHPVVQHVRNLASIANELFGRPIRGADEPAYRRAGGGPGGPGGATGSSAPAPAAVAQAPVFIYFDGKDHRTKAKVEELLRGRQITFKVLDVTDDEAERSWVTTTAKMTEFPIVVIAGTPVGGLGELTQLDLDGELKRRVFGAA
jgi:glutaredoxin-related protein